MGFPETELFVGADSGQPLIHGRFALFIVFLGLCSNANKFFVRGSLYICSASCLPIEGNYPLTQTADTRNCVYLKIVGCVFAKLSS